MLPSKHIGKDLYGNITSPNPQKRDVISSTSRNSRSQHLSRTVNSSSVPTNFDRSARRGGSRPASGPNATEPSLLPLLNSLRAIEVESELYGTNKAPSYPYVSASTNVMAQPPPLLPSLPSRTSGDVTRDISQSQRDNAKYANSQTLVPPHNSRTLPVLGIPQEPLSGRLAGTLNISKSTFSSLSSSLSPPTTDTLPTNISLAHASDEAIAAAVVLVRDDSASVYSRFLEHLAKRTGMIHEHSVPYAVAIDDDDEEGDGKGNRRKGMRGWGERRREQKVANGGSSGSGSGSGGSGIDNAGNIGSVGVNCIGVDVDVGSSGDGGGSSSGSSGGLYGKSALRREVEARVAAEMAKIEAAVDAEMGNIEGVAVEAGVTAEIANVSGKVGGSVDMDEGGGGGSGSGGGGGVAGTEMVGNVRMGRGVGREGCVDGHEKTEEDRKRERAMEREKRFGMGFGATSTAPEFLDSKGFSENIHVFLRNPISVFPEDGSDNNDDKQTHTSTLGNLPPENPNEFSEWEKQLDSEQNHARTLLHGIAKTASEFRHVAVTKKEANMRYFEARRAKELKMRQKRREMRAKEKNKGHDGDRVGEEDGESGRVDATAGMDRGNGSTNDGNDVNNTHISNNSSINDRIGDKVTVGDRNLSKTSMVPSKNTYNVILLNGEMDVSVWMQGHSLGNTSNFRVPAANMGMPGAHDDNDGNSKSKRGSADSDSGIVGDAGTSVGIGAGKRERGMTDKVPRPSSSTPSTSIPTSTSTSSSFSSSPSSSSFSSASSTRPPICTYRIPVPLSRVLQVELQAVDPRHTIQAYITTTPPPPATNNGTGMGSGIGMAMGGGMGGGSGNGMNMKGNLNYLSKITLPAISGMGSRKTRTKTPSFSIFPPPPSLPVCAAGEMHSGNGKKLLLTVRADFAREAAMLITEEEEKIRRLRMRGQTNDGNNSLNPGILSIIPESGVVSDDVNILRDSRDPESGNRDSLRRNGDFPNDSDLAAAVFDDTPFPSHNHHHNTSLLSSPHHSSSSHSSLTHISHPHLSSSQHLHGRDGVLPLSLPSLTVPQSSAPSSLPSSSSSSSLPNTDSNNNGISTTTRHDSSSFPSSSLLSKTGSENAFPIPNSHTSSVTNLNHTTTSSSASSSPPPGLAYNIPALMSLFQRYSNTDIIFFCLPPTKQPRFQQSKKKSVNAEIQTSALSVVHCYYYLTVSCIGAFTIRCALQPALDTLTKKSNLSSNSASTTTSTHPGTGISGGLDISHLNKGICRDQYVTDEVDSDEDIDLLRGTRPIKKNGVRGTHTHHDRLTLSSLSTTARSSHDRLAQRSGDIARFAERERLMAIVARNAPQLYARLEALRGDTTMRDAVLSQMQEKYGKLFHM